MNGRTAKKLRRIARIASSGMEDRVLVQKNKKSPLINSMRSTRGIYLQLKREHKAGMTLVMR